MLKEKGLLKWLNSNGFREGINVLRRLLFARGKTFMCTEYSPCGKQSVRCFMNIIAFNFYSVAFEDKNIDTG